MTSENDKGRQNHSYDTYKLYNIHISGMRGVSMQISTILKFEKCSISFVLLSLRKQ